MSTRIPLAPGTVLGRYRLAGLAGEGGMGDIYEAVDITLERRVALKRIRGRAADDATQERFRREALALAQLNHPGICQIYELAETSHGSFIVMEWIEGETVYARLRRGPMAWREAAEILRQTAEALAAAHAKGLVHRDLKPSNLMVTGEGRVKVLDFGLVRFTGQDSPPDPVPPSDEAPTMAGDPGDLETYAAPLSGSGSGRALTRVGSFMGTLGYTSPEQALARSVTPASDLFNLGLLAQEMLTGERAFKGEGRDAIDAVVDHAREPFPRGLAPKGYRALTDRLLSPKPKARPTAQEAALGFQKLLSPHGPLWWSALSAASVALIVAGGYWLFGRGAIAGLVKGRPARLVVMGFRNGTGAPLLEAQTRLGLADLLASRLRMEQKLQLVAPDALAQAAHALGLDPAGASPEDQIRLAKALGADLLISGEVDREGGKDRLRFLLRDTRDRVRARGEAEAKQLSETMLDAVPLAQAAARDLQKAVDPLSKSARPAPYAITPEAFAAYAQGLEAYRRGRYKEAEPSLKRAAYAAPEWSEAVAAYSFTLSNLARPESDAALEWALIAARKNGNAQSESAVVQTLAHQSWRRQEFGVAEGYYQQGLRAASDRGDQASRAFCLNGLGLLDEAQGRPDAAAQRYREALQAADQCGDQITHGKALTNLGNLALAKGDLPEAARCYQAVVDNARLIGSETNEALGLNNLGIVQLSEFHGAEARAALERSLALREKNGDAYGVVSALRNLGITALMEGKDADARTWFQRSLDQASAIAFVHGQGQAEFYLAEGERRAGDLRAALKGYQAASIHSESASDRPKLGMEKAGQAECLLRLHQGPEGEAALAASALLIPGNPYLLRAQAWSARLRGDHAAALKLLDQAIQDPRHDAPELRPELEGLRSRFALP